MGIGSKSLRFANRMQKTASRNERKRSSVEISVALNSNKAEGLSGHRRGSGNFMDMCLADVMQKQINLAVSGQMGWQSRVSKASTNREHDSVGHLSSQLSQRDNQVKNLSSQLSHLQVQLDSVQQSILDEAEHQ